MSRRIAAAILGGADGITSISGVVAGGAAAHIGHDALGRTVLAGALAAAESMAGGELLSETRTDWGAVGSMGIGTLVGSGLPALPLFLGGVTSAGIPLLLLLAIAGAAVVIIGLVRARVTHRSKSKSILQTLGVLLLGAAIGFVAGKV